jgi:hypothetical protein
MTSGSPRRFATPAGVAASNPVEYARSLPISGSRFAPLHRADGDLRANAVDDRCRLLDTPRR